MNKKYVVKQMANERWFLNFTEPNQKGETLIIELEICKDWDSKNSLPKLWYKNGWTNGILKTWWYIQTYITDSEGFQFQMYNPKIKRSEDGKKNEINFDWMLEATEDNKEKLINEVYKLFSSATGETATEIKQRKIKEYAEQNNLKIFNTVPEGWIVLNSAYAPTGSILITNSISFKNKNRKEGLLMVA